MGEPLAFVIGEGIKGGITFLLGSYSALDRYFKIKDSSSYFLNTDATLISLAKIFEGLKYPGFPFVDASLSIEDKHIFFRCVDDLDRPPSFPFTAMNLLYHENRKVFLDPHTIYQDLRNTKLVCTGNNLPKTVILMEASAMVSRYHYELEPGIVSQLPHHYVPSPMMQKHLLELILTSPYPWKGLSLLKEYGFIERYWPELSRMDRTEHAKEYHPEGNVWMHSLESLKYRKKADLTLSLAILLHDIGKPVSEKTQDKPFNSHSELGAHIAVYFLQRMGFERSIRENVAFLIRFHMIPHALKKLPLYRTEKLMDSPLFPLLLELYRADVSSTFRGPQGYYDACRIFKQYLKNKKNPYRTKGGLIHADKNIMGQG
ncbi:MAG: HD domain-containing protein [Spirochaetales bacterium]|nr:HD domain-containing protein [Spirochaetales bacterium]